MAAEGSDSTMAVANATPSFDISVRYSGCLTSLKEHLVALNLPGLTSTSGSGGYPTDTLVESVLEEFGRLRAWGEETRAALPAASRASLDHTLRKDDELKQTVGGILAKVQRQIERGEWAILLDDVDFYCYSSNPLDGDE